jgi:hypothetical protein
MLGWRASSTPIFPQAPSVHIVVNLVRLVLQAPSEPPKFPNRPQKAKILEGSQGTGKEGEKKALVGHEGIFIFLHSYSSPPCLAHIIRPAKGRTD